MTNGPGRLPQAALDALDTALAPVDAWTAARRAVDPDAVRPVHTVCVPAARATPGVCAAWGRAALEALDEHAPGPVSLAMATGLPADEVEAAWPDLRSVLRTRPVEDLRIELDGTPDDDAEDADAEDADAAVATLLAEAGDEHGPSRNGVRHRGIDAVARHRAVRTLDRVVGGLAEAGGPPDGFRLTLPGVVHVDQVAAYAALLRVLEVAHDLPEDRLVFELQVDAAEAVLDADGRVPLRAMIDAAGIRCVGLQLGSADVAAGASAAAPAAGRPVARTAEALAWIVAAGAGVEVGGRAIAGPESDDRAAHHAHWRRHAELVLGERVDGVVQGRDVHPAQLVTRHLVALVLAARGTDAPR